MKREKLKTTETSKNSSKNKTRALPTSLPLKINNNNNKNNNLISKINNKLTSNTKQNSFRKTINMKFKTTKSSPEKTLLTNNLESLTKMYNINNNNINKI